jgi:3-oxoacyl-[acyl-carrier-protein] synthase III
MKIGLTSVASCLPGEVLTVKEYYAYLAPEIAKLPEDEKRSLLRTAPETVHRLKDRSALEHMALSAAQKAVDEAGLSAADIDGLLATQTGGKQFMPLLAAYLQLNLGLRREITARNINDNNISVLNMMNLARIYVGSGICRRVLLVAAGAQIGGKYSFGADLTEPWSLHLGDGAGAAIVSAENLKCEFLGFHSETHAVTPRITATLNGDYGPVREPNNRALCFAAEMDDAYGAFLVSYDPALRKIAGGETFLTDSLGRAAAKAGLWPGDIKHIVPAHIGDLHDIWERNLAAAGMKTEVLKNTQKTVGNTACADPLIDLAAFSKSGTFRKDDILALWVPCTGVRLASVFLKWH